MRRAAERIERTSPEFRRHAVDDAPAPAVERIGGAVMRLRRLGELHPAAPAGEADEDDRRNLGQPIAALLGFERETAISGESARRDRFSDGGKSRSCSAGHDNTRCSVTVSASR